MLNFGVKGTGILIVLALLILVFFNKNNPEVAFRDQMQVEGPESLRNLTTYSR
jgi:hypothetical protein